MCLQEQFYISKSKIPTLKMVIARIFFVLITLLTYSNSEYIPPGPRYPCPKEREQIHPCVCVNGTDAGLYLQCENTGLAVLSVGLGNLAELEIPVEKLTLKECKITNLFGSLFHRSIIRVIEIIDTPIREIDQYTFAGVNRTLQELYIKNAMISEFPTEALKILGNLTDLVIDGHTMTKLDKAIFAGSLAGDRLERLRLTNGQISDIPPEAFQNLRKLRVLDLHSNRLGTLKRNQFRGMRELEVLDVSYNNITKLDGSHIGDLTKLGWCNVSHNLLNDLPRAMFARNTILKVLHLDNNKIRKLDTNSFKGMRTLRRLFLQDNQITEVGRDTFSSVKRIGTIDLARNKITKIDFQMFQEVKYAELIDLAENQITIIENQAFTDLYLAVVNISHNALETIEAGSFQNCNNMTLLDLSHNRLEAINPKAFDENTYASELQVSYNKFTDFGKIPIHNMTGVRVLNVSFNAIQQIPRNAFPKLYELHTVDVSYNNLSEIYNAVFQNLFSLRYLNLSHNSMEQIKPSTFGTLPTVIQLDLSHNQLREVSRGSLYKMASCRLLDISHNYLDKIFQIPISLSELNFANNNLTELKPNTWPTMNALLRLNLSSNNIGDNLPSEAFASLLTLQVLDLSENGITLPPWQALSTLSSLQYLHMKRNNLTSLSKSSFGNQPTLFFLDLSYNQIGSIAQQSFNGLLQLLHLSLSGNNLSYIPNEALKTLVALRKLDLSYNNLQKIDNKTHGLLDDCLSLESVDLSHNKFGFIPKKTFPYDRWIPYRLLEVDLSYNEIPVLTLDLTIGTKKLKKLNLTGNVINEIRNEVLGNLSSLEVLDLSDNKLRDLTSITTPEKFNLPSNLTRMYLQNNMLTTLPIENIAKLENLQLLDLRNNRLSEFNVELVKKMKRNVDIYFEGNILNCDCFVRPLKHLLNHLSHSELVLNYNKYNITCEEPVALEGESLITLDEDRLLCAGNILLEDKIKSVLTDEEISFELTTEPDLVFREIQFSQETIDVKWFVLSKDDIADFFVYVRDDKTKLYYNKDLTYNTRDLSIPVDKNLAGALRTGDYFEVCVQARKSDGLPRKWHQRQCKQTPPNFDLWEKSVRNDIVSIIRKTIGHGYAKKNVIGLVSDSILITLCIFLGACFNRLADFDI